MANYKYKSDEIVKWIFFILGGGIALFAILSGYGINVFGGENYISAAAKQTNVLMHIIGTLLYGGAGFLVYQWVADNWEANAKSALIALALFGLGIAFNMGFNF